MLWRIPKRDEYAADSSSMLADARAAAEKQLSEADTRSKAQLADAQKKYDAQHDPVKSHLFN